MYLHVKKIFLFCKSDTDEQVRALYLRQAPSKPEEGCYPICMFCLCSKKSAFRLDFKKWYKVHMISEGCVREYGNVGGLQCGVRGGKGTKRIHVICRQKHLKGQSVGKRDGKVKWCCLRHFWPKIFPKVPGEDDGWMRVEGRSFIRSIRQVPRPAGPSTQEAEPLTRRRENLGRGGDTCLYGRNSNLCSAESKASVDENSNFSEEKFRKASFG